MQFPFNLFTKRKGKNETLMEGEVGEGDFCFCKICVERGNFSPAVFSAGGSNEL